MALAVQRQTRLSPGDSRSLHLVALSEGAAMLAQAGNRVAAIALLREAIGLAPTDFDAHRRLAAALATGGDRVAASEEYARYIGLALQRGDVRRAAMELTYARGTLGQSLELRAAGAQLVPLEFVAQALTTGMVLVDPSPVDARPSKPQSAPIDVAAGPIRGFAFQVDGTKTVGSARLVGLLFAMGALVAFAASALR